MRIRARLKGRLGPVGGRNVRGIMLRLGVVALILMVVVGYAGTAYAQSVFDNLPAVKGLDAAAWIGDTRIYDSSGNVLLADLGQERRQAVHLSDISPKLIQATVATEDRTFWTNRGYDMQGIGRAALGYLRHRQVVGGGSTITQQLAKQMWLTPQQNLSRKIEEVALASKLTDTYSKQQILEAYLNRNNYAQQQYGVQAASQTYFGKNAKDLDLAQSALLAGIPQAPAVWDPVRDLPAAKERQRVVLNSMVSAGYITPQEAHTAFLEPLTYQGQKTIGKPHYDYKVSPQFIQYVTQELTNLGYTAGQQQLKVTTTLDWGKQQLAQSTVEGNLNNVKSHDPGGQLSSAMIAMDPKTGFIKAYVGSPNTDFDFLGGIPEAMGGRYVNPGSSVKPFTYGAAIANRVATMDTPVLDGPSPYIIPGEPKPVTNYDGRSHGSVPLKKALASSLNIPAIKVEQAAGIGPVVGFMRSMGLHPKDVNQDPNGPPANYRASLTLGGAPVTLLDEAIAYSTYADKGTRHQPEAIQEIRGQNQAVVYKAQPETTAQQVIDPGVAFIVSAMISDDSNRSYGFKPGGPLNLPGRHAAAKTGTTDNFTDALTAGYTPDLVSVIWVGDYLGNGHHMDESSDGVFIAAPAWNRFMTEALKGVPDSWYEPPSNVVKQGNSWFLKDATKITNLPNDKPMPSPSASPSPGGSEGGVAPNPGLGPAPVLGGGPRPPRPTVPPICWLPPCPSPSPTNGNHQPPGG